MVDRIISGRYRINNQLGSGGMGIVYHAHDVKLRRDVALKVIAPHLVEDEEARARFLREAQALAGLSHPNIVTVFDLAEEADTGLVFIVMELLNGLPLRKHITNPARPAFYDMAIQVCRALEHAHGNGVLHRDIKPENIFVCNDGTVKLMDFGLARLVDGATVNSSTVVTGTVAYMSPEQLRGGALDARTDLYGLGVLFYEYLSGYTPFASDSPGTMLLKHLTEPAPSIRLRVPAVSPDLDALILVLLAKEPEKRYPSALILRDSLERIRAKPSTAAAPIAAPTSAGPAMPATLIPLCGPTAAGPMMPTRTPIAPPRHSRPRHSTPPRHAQSGMSPEVRTAALVCVVLLGALLVYAIGETVHTMSARPPEPPKKSSSAGKTARGRSRSSGGSHGTQGRRRAAGGHGGSTESPATSAGNDTAKAQEDPPGDTPAPGEGAADENPPDDKAKPAEPDAGGA